MSSEDHVCESNDYVLDYHLKDINGKTVDLNEYKGNVLLIVNTAS